MLIHFTGNCLWWNLRVRQRELVPHDLYIHRLLMGKYFQESCKLKKQIFNLIIEYLQCFDNMHKVADVVFEELLLLLTQMKARTWTMPPPLLWLDFIHICLRSSFWTLFHISMFFFLSLSSNLIKIDFKSKAYENENLYHAFREFILIFPHTNQNSFLFLYYCMEGIVRLWLQWNHIGGLGTQTPSLDFS